jgi:DNA-binding XRE family transcriptional regulator
MVTAFSHEAPGTTGRKPGQNIAKEKDRVPLRAATESRQENDHTERSHQPECRRIQPRGFLKNPLTESRTDTYPHMARAVYIGSREESDGRLGDLTARAPARQDTIGEWKGVVLMLTLREARLRRRMSQQSLADRAGVARVTVSQIELGKSGPRPHIARRIAEALGTQPSEIIEFGAAAQSMRLPTPSILAELENDQSALS